MSKLNVGLVGCGFIAEKHIKTLNRLSDLFTVRALVDINPDHMTKLKSLIHTESNDVTLYHSYSDLLQRQDIDVVIITVPSWLHGKFVLEALQHSKHVIVEKPLSLSLKEVDQIIELAEAANKQVLVCHQMRYRPMFQKIKTLVDKEQFGQPYLASASIMVNRSKDYYLEADWRGTWTFDGGMVLNQGLHVADLLLWYLGDVDWIYGVTHNYVPWKETEDIALGIMKFSNGAYGNIVATSQVQPTNLGYGLQLICQNGTLAISGPALNQIDHFYIKHGHISLEKFKEIALDFDDRLYMYQDFHKALTLDEHIPLMTANEAKKILTFIFGLYQSSRSLQALRFPLDHFNTWEQQENANKE